MVLWKRCTQLRACPCPSSAWLQPEAVWEPSNFCILTSIVASHWFFEHLYAVPARLLKMANVPRYNYYTHINVQLSIGLCVHGVFNFPDVIKSPVHLTAWERPSISPGNLRMSPNHLDFGFFLCYFILSLQIPDRYRSGAFCWGGRERGLDYLLSPGSPAGCQAGKVVVGHGTEHGVMDRVEGLHNSGTHELEIWGQEGWNGAWESWTEILSVSKGRRKLLWFPGLWQPFD